MPARLDFVTIIQFLRILTASEAEMNNKCPSASGLVVQGKTIAQFILELGIFENQLLLVEISLGSGPTHKPISLIAKKEDRFCVLNNLEASYLGEKVPNFVVRGKTIAQLIKELRTYENQELFVEISFDDGRTCEPVGRVENKGEIILIYTK